MRIKKLLLSNDMSGKVMGCIIISLMVMFLGIMFGGMVHFKKTNGLILKGDLTCEFREEVYVEDFILEIDGTLLDNYRVDTSEVGVQSVVIQFRNRYGFVEVKKFQIEVKDVTAPMVVVDSPYVWNKGETKEFGESIFCADDYDDNVLCEIKGEYNLEEVGEYPLTIRAVDASNNETIVDFVLKVVEKKTSSNKGTGLTKTTSFKSVYQAYKTDNTLVGVDLSKWQGEVDFAEIKKQGVEFVMLKLGGQTKINGEFNLDPKFYDNLQGALENDLEVGVYFYSYARSESEAKRQARFIVDSLGDYEISLPVVFDWENWNSFSKFKISFHTLNKVASAFMEEVSKFGYEGMLYSSKYYLETIWYQEDYVNWLAYYTDNNDYFGKYLMWQLCSNGRIKGIDGDVDIDIMYLDE